ncbi:MAG: hypothetical protein ACTHMG_09270 [Sphingomonas sp.]
MKTRLLPLIVAAMLAVPASAERHDKKAPPPAPPPSSIDGLPFGGLPQQELPAKGCAAFLWSAGTTHALVAMAGADPAELRVSLGGTVAAYPLVAQHGVAGFGFDETTTYRAGDVTLRLDMTIEPQADLTQGAAVPRGTLTLERQGQDTVVLPVAGLIGCATAGGGTP